MYMVYSNVLICAVVVPLLYCELYFDIPSMKALVLSFDLDLDQQLAFVYVVALQSFPYRSSSPCLGIR